MAKRSNEVRAEMQGGGPPEFQMRHRMQLALECSGVPVGDIANQLGVARTTVSNWMHGRTQPQRAHLIAWATITNVDFSWLETGEASPN